MFYNKFLKFLSFIYKSKQIHYIIPIINLIIHYYNNNFKDFNHKKKYRVQKEDEY